MNIPPDDNVPVYPGKPLTEEHKRLNALFDEMKKGQLTFLDEAGKRIIELSSALLGVLFAVTALGNDFPPLYLQGKPFTQGLAIYVLAAFIMALLAGVITVQPRSYDYYESNLSEMRKQLNLIVAHKSRWMKIATWSFFAGTLLLAILIASLVISA
jgi:hypothetical protein